MPGRKLVVVEPILPPYNVGDLGEGVRRTAPAVARNVGPIGDVLAEWLPSKGAVLEIASGTGEHALAFANRFPALTFVPSDPDPQALASIAAWRSGGPGNLAAPVLLDARDADWGIERADAVLSINMVHIAPWAASLGLLDGAAQLLQPGAPLILYGPWRISGEALAPSNAAFDGQLKARNPEWGLRDTDEFASEADTRGLRLVEQRRMPSNNLMLLFRRS